MARVAGDRPKDPPTRQPVVAEARQKVRTIRRGPTFEDGKAGWIKEDLMDDVRELTFRRLLAGQDVRGGYLDMQPNSVALVDIFDERDMTVVWRGNYPVQLKWTAELQGTDEHICVWEPAEAGSTVSVEAQRKDWNATSADRKINLEVARKQVDERQDNDNTPPPPPPYDGPPPPPKNGRGGGQQ